MTRPAPSTALTNALIAGHEQNWFRYIGTFSGVYTVEAGPHRRAYGADAMRAWLDGHTAARTAPRTRRARRSLATLEPVRRVLVNPGLADQMRTQIRLAMQDAGLSSRGLADRISRTSKAVLDALRYGDAKRLSVKMAEQMMAGCDGVWQIGYRPAGGGEPVLATLAEAGREPNGLVRARALAICHTAGLLNWAGTLSPGGDVEDPDPTRCFHTRSFFIKVGGSTHQPAADVVVPWVTGVADALSPTVAEALTQPETGPAATPAD